MADGLDGRASFRGRQLVATDLALPASLTCKAPTELPTSMVLVAVLEMDGNGDWAPKAGKVERVTQWHHDSVDSTMVAGLRRSVDYIDMMQSFMS